MIGEIYALIIWLDWEQSIESIFIAVGNMTKSRAISESGGTTEIELRVSYMDDVC